MSRLFVYPYVSLLGELKLTKQLKVMKMRLFLSLLLYGAAGVLCCAQDKVRFSYDASGNIIKRYVEYGRTSETDGYRFETSFNASTCKCTILVRKPNGDFYRGSINVFAVNVITGARSPEVCVKPQGSGATVEVDFSYLPSGVYGLCIGFYDPSRVYNDKLKFKK